MKKAIWESFLALKDKKDIFLDLEHYLSELYKWTKDNSSRFNKELLARNRIDVILELDNILDYLGCDAEIYLDKEVERVFKNMPKKEELFLMCLGSTLWDLLRKRTGKDCPRCKDDELNYVVAETEKGRKIVLECDTCGWTEYLNGKRWEEGNAKIYPVSNIEIESIMQD